HQPVEVPYVEVLLFHRRTFWKEWIETNRIVEWLCRAAFRAYYLPMSMSTLREPVARCRPLVQGSPPRIKAVILKATQTMSVQPESNDPPSALVAQFLSTSNSSSSSDTLARQVSNPISANPSKLPGIQPSYRSKLSATLSRTDGAGSTRSPSLKKTMPRKKTPSARNIATTALAPELVHGQESERAQILYTYTTFEPKPNRLYVKTAAEANRMLESMTGPLGFDMEWRILYRKNGSQNKTFQRPVAVVQIANRRSILIIQTSAMKGG
ncbi:12484_t:CDS:2, partial [Acaulospora colombiana]